MMSRRHWGCCVELAGNIIEIFVLFVLFSEVRGVLIHLTILYRQKITIKQQNSLFLCKRIKIGYLALNVNCFLIIKIKLTLMNCESLYQQSKWKRQQQRALEQEHVQQIRLMSASKKINPNSHSILVNKISEQLMQFSDDQVLNIQTSIPLLHATHLLQAIESIESAKQKLEQGEFENSRLKEEARFVYCLWKMIDEQEIETRELKEIIYMLNEKQPVELIRKLNQIYHNEEAVTEFVETWRALLQENQYYRSMQKMEKKKQALRQSKDLNYGGLKQCINESKQLREYFLNSKEGTSKSSKYLTSDSLRFPSDSKQNSQISKARQNAIIQRLYQIDKYKIRELYKKIEDEKRERQEMESCTFKPQLTNDRLRSASANKRSSSINGYQKAVQRMKVGQEKTRIQKQKIQYKPTGQNYEKLREKKPNPPSFLQRKKKQQKIQFVIEFDLGRHKIKAKIRQSDDEQSIARNLCKIYCLKQEYFQQICTIIRNQREIYLTQQQNL